MRKKMTEKELIGTDETAILSVKINAREGLFWT